MKHNIIGGYVGGALFKWTDTEVKTVTNCGLNYIVAWEAGVSPKGDITYNFGPVAKGGKYVGGSALQDRFALLKESGEITTILLSLGNGTGYSSYQNMSALGFKKGGVVYNNWKAIHDALPMIDGIDFDDEEGLSQNATVIVEFSKMLKEIGFNQVTFCPYMQRQEWNNAYSTLQGAYPGFVTHYNLQCYSGGAGNNPVQWIEALPAGAPENLVLPGLSHDNTPADVASILKGWHSASHPLQGAWLWNLDKITPGKIAGYVQAIKKGLSDLNTKLPDATAAFNIVNNSNPTVPGDSIFICIVGTDPQSGAYTYLDLNAGSATYGQLVNFTEYKSGSTSQPLSQITTPIPVPRVKSARMYFAIGSDFSSSEFAPVSVPSPSQVDDGGASVLFDFVEFDTSGSDLNINSTNVDMYAISYTMSLTDSGGKEVIAGIGATRTQMMTEFTQIPEWNIDPTPGSTAWYQQLFVRDAEGNVLRFLAPQQPGYADFATGGADYQMQLTQYLADYVNNEVFKPNRQFSFYDKFYPNQKNTYYAQVSGDGQTMSIYSDQQMKNLHCQLNPPSNAWGNPAFPTGWHNVTGSSDSIDWGFALLGNSLVPGTPAGWGFNNGTDPAIMAILISICRGVAHLDNGCADWVNPAKYFQGGSPVNNFPVEYYAKTIHTNGLNGLAYAFAYDDIYSQNPSVSFNPGTEITFSLNSLEAFKEASNVIDILTVIDCESIIEATKTNPPSLTPGTQVPGTSLGSYAGSDPFVYMIACKNFLVNDPTRAGSELEVAAGVGDTIRWTMTCPGAGLKYNALITQVGIGPGGAQNSITVPTVSSAPREVFGTLNSTPKVVDEIVFTATVIAPGTTQYYIAFQITDNAGSNLGYYYWDPFITVSASSAFGKEQTEGMAMQMEKSV